MIPLLFAFQIDIDPMSRLLLINFEKDPDTIYVGFEPQVFDDEQNGKGHLVIGWRKDGRVDIYHQPSLNPDPKKYDIVGKGLASIKETHFEMAHFILTDRGIEASYSFNDLSGRKVMIHIEEKNKKLRKSFDLLAPMGQAAENPSALPLILLFDFYFVRKKQTEFIIQINGKNHQADKMPLWLDGSRIFFTRYSTKPLIATFNPAQQGEIFPISSNSEELIVSENQHEDHLSKNSKGTVLNKISRINPVAPLEIDFDPPFPNLTEKKEGAISGKFKIISEPSIGIIEGTYQVVYKGKLIQVRINPSSGWNPKPDRLFLKVMYWIAKPFKNWPKTYQWDASISMHGSSYYIDSQWKRINKN